MANEIANAIHAQATVAGTSYRRSAGFTGNPANPGLGAYNLTLSQPLGNPNDGSWEGQVFVTQDVTSALIVSAQVNDANGALINVQFIDPATGLGADPNRFDVLVLKYPTNT